MLFALDGMMVVLCPQHVSKHFQIRDLPRLRQIEGSLKDRGRSPHYALAITMTPINCGVATGSAAIRCTMHRSSLSTKAALSAAERFLSKALANVGPKAARKKPAW